MFVLTDKPTIHEMQIDNGMGVVTIRYRTFQGDERDRFDKAHSKIAGSKKYPEKYRELMKWAADLLLVGWDGVVDAEKKPVPFTDEAKAAFLAHSEAEIYWYTAIRRYISPRVLQGEDGTAPEEIEDDPDFLPGK